MIILTTIEDERSVARYSQRFWIEPMFNDQQSNGFELEQTRVTDAKRLETLLILSVLAHLFCSCEGARQETQGVLPKKHAELAGFVRLDCFWSASKPLNNGFDERHVVNFSSFYEDYSPFSCIHCVSKNVRY